MLVCLVGMLLILMEPATYFRRTAWTKFVVLYLFFENCICLLLEVFGMLLTLVIGCNF